MLNNCCLTAVLEPSGFSTDKKNHLTLARVEFITSLKERVDGKRVTVLPRCKLTIDARYSQVSSKGSPFAIKIVCQSKIYKTIGYG